MGTAFAFIVMGLTLASPNFYNQTNTETDSALLDAEIEPVVQEYEAIKDLPITQDELGEYNIFNAEDEVCGVVVCGFWANDGKGFIPSYRIKIKYLTDKYFSITEDTENWKHAWKLRNRFESKLLRRLNEAQSGHLSK